MVPDADRAADCSPATGLAGDSIGGGRADCRAGFSHASSLAPVGSVARGLCGSLFEFGLKHATGMGKGGVEGIEQRLDVPERASTADRFNLLTDVRQRDGSEHGTA